MDDVLHTWFASWEPSEIASIGIASIAFVLSLVSTIYSLRTKKIEEHREIRTLLNGAVSKLLEIQMENAKSYQESVINETLKQYQILSSTYNQQFATPARLAVSR